MNDKIESVILISTADWEHPFWTNKQYVAEQLSNLGVKVLYFDSLGLRKPQGGDKRDRSRIFKRVLNFLKGPRKVRENLWVFSPIVIPNHGNALISKLNDILMMNYIYLLSLILNFDRKWFWTYNPLSHSFLRFFKGRVVYHSVDDLTAAPGLPHEKIVREEQKLLKMSSFVFVTSRDLEKKYQPLVPEKLFYFSNVADYNHFSQAKGHLDIPSDLKNIPHPQIGFIGAVSEYKVDIKLIEDIAKNNPDLHWVIIGQVGEGEPGSSVGTMKNYSNIHLLGPRAYVDLPNYLKSFDVVTLPCPINNYTKAMFPMKFFEYLAAGKDIVATDLPALRDFSNLYYRCESIEQFENSILEILEGKSKVDAREREAVAKEYTYEARTKKMLQVIDTRS